MCDHCKPSWSSLFLVCARHVDLLVCDHIWRCAGVQAHLVENYRIPAGTDGILCVHHPVLYRQPFTNISFVLYSFCICICIPCDTNTSYVVIYATENIWLKGHQCLLSKLGKLWRVMKDSVHVQPNSPG